jgi:hypothetical protein
MNFWSFESAYFVFSLYSNSKAVLLVLECILAGGMGGLPASHATRPAATGSQGLPLRATGACAEEAKDRTQK